MPVVFRHPLRPSSVLRVRDDRANAPLWNGTEADITGVATSENQNIFSWRGLSRKFGSPEILPDGQISSTGRTYQNRQPARIFKGSVRRICHSASSIDRSHRNRSQTSSPSRADRLPAKFCGLARHQHAVVAQALHQGTDDVDGSLRQQRKGRDGLFIFSLLGKSNKTASLSSPLSFSEATRALGRGEVLHRRHIAIWRRLHDRRNGISYLVKDIGRRTPRRFGRLAQQLIAQLPADRSDSRFPRRVRDPVRLRHDDYQNRLRKPAPRGC